MKKAHIPTILIEVTEVIGQLQGEVIHVLKPGLFSKNEMLKVLLQTSPRQFFSVTLLFRKDLEPKVDLMSQGDKTPLLRFINDTLEMSSPKDDIRRQLGVKDKRLN